MLGATGGVVAAISIGNTAPPQPPPSNHPVSLEVRPARVLLSAQEWRAIVSDARLFLRTAVSRHHPEQAWSISTRSLRSGQTLDQWKDGVLAVEPYPVRFARWNLAYSDANEVGLDVWVDSGDVHYPPLVFRLTFARAADRQGGHRWLVDSWAPVTMSAPIATALSPAASAGVRADGPRASARSSPIWIVAPFAVLGAALLVPLIITLRTRLSERRAIAALHQRPLP